jgi:hypothetical protein
MVGAGLGGGAVPGGWGVGDGLVAAEWALQPVMAMAAANMTVAMILAGRMAIPPNSTTLCGPRASAQELLDTGRATGGRMR